MRHIVGAACAAILLTATAWAQGAGGGAAPGTVGAQQRPATPARDTSAIPKKGTAVIRGRVVAADTGRPLRRARISLTSAELGPEGRRTVSTNLDGAFEIKDLPAARYTLSVARGGYLSLQYGQRRPSEQGRPLQVGDGEVLAKIDFALPRMGTISGHVTDETGEPIEGVSLYAMRLLYFEGRRKLVPISGSTTTDDRGEYRINRLQPGSYAVMASTKETWTVTENGKDTVYGYMPTYFPGVVIGSEARRVTLKVGQEVPAIDFSLVPGRAAKITGQALDSQGRPFARVSLTDEVKGLGFSSFGSGPDVSVSPDGSFTALNVPPGEYKLIASRQATEEGGPEAALTTVNVEGNDIENIMLVGSSGGTVSGRIVMEEGSAPPKMSAVSVQVVEPYRGQPSATLLGTFKDFGFSRVKEDGTWAVSHVFGRARMQVTVPDGWMVKSITRDGRDVADGWLQLVSGEELSGIDVLLTSRVTKIDGQLLDERNQPLRDATVLIFPSDADKWFENSKTIRAARLDQQGRWQAKGLPAGEYLAIALDYVEDGAWNDPEYLESLRRDAKKVTLADGASETVALKVTVPKQ
jgi:protocatechuate 3,4-dioxygenase beta subunit